MEATKLQLRKDVPVEQTWDMESIFPTLGDWEKAFKEIEETLPQLQAFKGTLGENAKNLIKWFENAEAVEQKIGKLIIYGYGFSEVDADDQNGSANRDKALGLNSRVNAAISFAEPELLTIGFEKLKEWVQQESKLTEYGHYFDKLEKRAKHIRSDEVEELLSAVSDPFQTAARTHGVLANADMKIESVVNPDGGEAIELAHTNYRKLRSDPQREVRKGTWQNYADAHLAYKNTMANALSAGVKQQVFASRARKYDSALEAALSENFIPVDVFHNLIEAYKANLPTWHKYWDLRKRALKLDEMHIYDTRAILSEKAPELSFEHTMNWIEAGMAPMGEEYVSAMRKGVREQRWVDYARNKGKRFGAFSMGVKGTHPFIMMTFNDDVLSLSTLAHELGHSMHSYYTTKTQPQVNADYTLFVAEVASNFNQALVRDHLLKTETDPDIKIAIIEEAMSNFHRYFFTMPTLARFELEIHERIERGEALSADSMIDLIADLFTEGYGPGVVVDRERVGSVWMQFSTHLYSNFYVFQYATGISGAHALAERVLNGGDEARDDYLAFLKAGGSVYPLDALKLAGVDMSTPDAVNKTFEVLAGYVDQLESLLF
ncbi:MAG: oligoendopeptidase F [Chloroflexota bacterium]